ncbi:MAG: DnaA N-terminal domain-containing protein, partial [Gammaproteobacteria bacterium]
MDAPLWKKCLDRLETELPEQQFNTWIRPLHAVADGQCLRLLAPNRFVLDWVREHFYAQIHQAVQEFAGAGAPQIALEVGTRRPAQTEAPATAEGAETRFARATERGASRQPASVNHTLNPTSTFENFVEGKSNQLARAAAAQVGENPGGAYNPLFIYGGV